MRWPIRNQILLPFVAIQTLTIVAIAVGASYTAVANVDREIQSRLRGIVSTLESTSFPLTEAILENLRQLTGAHFVVLDAAQRPIQTTTLVEPDVFLGWTNDEWRRSEIRPSGPLAVVSLGAEKFFIGRVSRSLRGGPASVLVLYRHSDWQLARRQAMWPPLVIGGTLLFLVAMASVVIARRIGSRIQAMQTQVARIAGRDFTPVDPSRLDDELRDLAVDVNRMAALLEDSIQRIEETERSRIVTQLVGGLSHQLRNAITGALLSIQLHRRRCNQSDDSALEMAVQQLRFTEEQIKALLRAARGRSGPPRAGEIGRILDETMTLLRPVCEHQRITLRYTPLVATWPVADADAIRAALLNLLMNALEACGHRGTVTVRAEYSDPLLTLEIMDDGPGFAASAGDIHEIFHAFYTTKPEGMGLGLFLARQAVNDCSGELTAERRDNITVFRIVLRREASPKAESSIL